MEAPRLSRAGKRYVAAVVVCGALPITWSAAALFAAPADPRWLLLAALTLLTSPLSVAVPTAQASISISEAFVFASVLLFGPAPATLTVALDGLMVSLWSRNRVTYRTLFNVAEPAIYVWISAQLFYLLAGPTPLGLHGANFWRLLGPLLAMTTTYFVLNTGLTVTAIALEARTSPLPLLRAHLPHLSLNYWASVCLAILLVYAIDDLTLPALGVLVPLLAVSYLTSRASIARLEDAHRHVAELNELYVSTVETLAMAIDAKDQVTHGHIRRVQTQSVQLARALGVTDEREIKAIEAAALLHDLGKLAVPEQILNKRAALTPVEYEQMKAHPDIGAEILSGINFPYPVAPIVRHHHENWDGSGYPDGLRAEAIPMGARILAVVDCFDALTSDRPYRRRMPDDEAVRIICSRSGWMYDRRVVDRFVESYPTLRRSESTAHEEQCFAVVRRPLSARAAATTREAGLPPDHLGEIMVRNLAASVSGDGTWRQLGRSLASFVDQIAPDCLCVLFALDHRRDELVVVHASPQSDEHLRGERIALGQRLSGWVGSTRRTVVNSSPALDLAALGGAAVAGLQAAFSAPITHRGALAAVLTVYSAQPAGFDEQQARLLELLAAEISGRLQRIPDAEAPAPAAPDAALDVDRSPAAAAPERMPRGPRVH
jgi:putative nucleotidyltransferase with HDIG domain